MSTQTESPNRKGGSMNHYELSDRARQCWQKAQEIVSVAETQLEHGRIDIDTWNERLVDATLLQDEAAQLEKQAVDMQVEYWRNQYAEDIQRQKEYSEQMIDERPY